MTQEIEVEAVPLDRLTPLLSSGRAGRLLAAAARARSLLAGRVVWNVSATAHGGGVAEMLQGRLAYGRGGGVDTRWLVLDGNPAFFRVTKHVHNALHGAGDPASELGPAEHRVYERVQRETLATLETLVRSGDVVVLHDPQTAGLVDGVRALGAHTIWRSHIGRDDTNAQTDRGWAFLRPYVEHADAFVFSRQSYVPHWVAPGRARVIAPSIDPFSTKNLPLDDATVIRILQRVGLVDGAGDAGTVPFDRRDGTHGVLRGQTALLAGAEPPPADAPLVIQVSRWDLLKDMAGVLSAFADHVAPLSPRAHLMLVGPDVSGVTDDPEGAAVLADCRAVWARLPEPVRRRCSLACIPMDDVDENAIVVNALQRHATVVVQKSLAEGFGLTVTEALWKARPVLASAVGGIQDQIITERDGLLLNDPHDLTTFAQQLLRLLGDPGLRRRLGHRGQELVRTQFLADRHLTQYLELFEDLLRARGIVPDPG